MKRKTTIHTTERAHELIGELSELSGMSRSGVYVLGALTLCVRHARAIEHGVKRAHFLREVREAFEAEMQKIEEGSL